MRSLPRPSKLFLAPYPLALTGLLALGSVSPADAQVGTTTTFAESGAIVTFTAPDSAVYSFSVYGAQGGTGASEAGGLGAEAQGNVTLTAGEQLLILVGQAGGSYGGGGGSFVVTGTQANPTPLFVAGGGGAGGVNAVGQDGQTATTGGAGTGTESAQGGSAGSGGGATAPDSGGGGGLLSNGTGVALGDGGNSFVSGGAGGGGGGFGGGGGSSQGNGIPGGAGGYSGGGAGGLPFETSSSGGGGGSFVSTAATNVLVTSPVQSGDGVVTIEELTLTPTLVYTFSGQGSDGSNSDGAYPNSPLIQAEDGTFYGTAPSGGNGGYGTLFKFTSGGTLDANSAIHAFGANPNSGVIEGNDGNFYGVTTYGGDFDNAGLFFVANSNLSFLTYDTFNPGNGDEPTGALVLGRDGSFYGTAAAGGTSGNGTIYKVTADGVVTVVYNLGTADGATPLGALVQAADGNFYGTTSTGGADSGGTLFEVTPAGVFQKLYDFGENPGDGLNPQAGLLLASDGNFYGTTENDNVSMAGTVFQLSADGTTVQTIYTFSGGRDGGQPKAGLIEGTDGNLYGTTYSGGGHPGAGTVFSMSTSGTRRTLYTFADDDFGGYPTSPLLQGGDGNLYGAVAAAGANLTGTLVAFDVTLPYVVRFHAASNSAFESDGTAMVRVDRVGGSGALTVDYATADGSAAAGTDYQAAPGTLIWDAGDQTAKFIPISIINRELTDGSLRSLTIALTNPVDTNETTTVGAPALATLTINGSNPAGVLEFDAATYQVDENAGTVAINVQRLGGSAGGISVGVETASGTAKAGTDYTGSNQTLTWGDTDTSTKVLTVPIKDLGLSGGGSRYFFVKLLTPTDGASLGAPVRAKVTILDNDPVAGEIEFGATDYTVDESSGTLTVAVNRVGPGTGAVSATCGTESGVAQAGTDYLGLTRTLSWADGDTTPKSFAVPIYDTGISDNSTRYFFVRLADVTGGAVLATPIRARVSIDENDPQSGDLMLAQSSYSVGEAAGTVTVMVNRNAASRGATSVVCGTHADTAQPAVDYVGKSITLSWVDGDTTPKAFPVTIKNRGANGGGVKFEVQLSAPGSGSTLGSPATTLVTID